MPAPKGRPKPAGSGMKKGYTTSAKLKKNRRVEWILSILTPTFENDVKALDPKDRAKMFLDCMEYVQPKLARTEVKVQGDPDNPLYTQQLPPVLSRAEWLAAHGITELTFFDDDNSA